MNKKRLFTFGCSFTRYRWPTWADFIQFNYDEYHNWAKGAGCNHFIFHSLMEAHQRHNFTPNDTIIIVWTSYTRFSFLQEEGGWSLLGNLLSGHQPASIFRDFRNYWSIKGSILTSLHYMQSIEILLKTLGVNYFKSIIMDSDVLSELDPNFYLFKEYPEFKIYENVFKTDNWIKPTLTEWKFNYPHSAYRQKTTEDGFVNTDMHPTPQMHYDWVKQILIPKLNIKLKEEAAKLLRNWESTGYETIIPERF